MPTDHQVGGDKWLTHTVRIDAHGFLGEPNNAVEFPKTRTICLRGETHKRSPFWILLWRVPKTNWNWLIPVFGVWTLVQELSNERNLFPLLWCIIVLTSNHPAACMSCINHFPPRGNVSVIAADIERSYRQREYRTHSRANRDERRLATNKSREVQRM